MNSITIQSIQIHLISLPLLEVLTTSFGGEANKSAMLLEMRTSDGIVGWGESSAMLEPGYSYETLGSSYHILQEFLIPSVIGKTVNSPTELPSLMNSVRGYPLSKHAVEAAVWDAWAKTNGLKLADAFAYHLPEGHESRGFANVGVSIGIKATHDETIDTISKRLSQGYGRIKLKIRPGWDFEMARAVRKAFPNISLMLDANSAYTLDDAEHLKKADELNLLMMEQPLGYEDIYQHSKLQPQLSTDVCLDESIHSLGDAQLGFEIGAYRIINLKPARVTGYTESLAIYQFCVENEIPLWIGGLLETGVGRAANLAFASLPGVTLPCDISATDRYYDPDISEPAFYLSENSTIRVPDGIGIGVEIQADRLKKSAASWHTSNPYTSIQWD